MAAEESPTDAKKLDTALARLQFLERARANEDTLLSQRATWLMLSQSFLFATFSIVTAQIEQAHPSNVAHVLVRAIPIVGLSIAILVELAVVAAIFMLWTLYRRLVALSESPELADVGWPSARRPAVIMLLGQLPSIVAPLGLAVVWFVLLTHATR